MQKLPQEIHLTFRQFLFQRNFLIFLLLPIRGHATGTYKYVPAIAKGAIAAGADWSYDWKYITLP